MLFLKYVNVVYSADKAKVTIVRINKLDSAIGYLIGFNNSGALSGSVGKQRAQVLTPSFFVRNWFAPKSIKRNECVASDIHSRCSSAIVYGKENFDTVSGSNTELDRSYGDVGSQISSGKLRHLVGLNSSSLKQAFCCPPQGGCGDRQNKSKESRPSLTVDGQ